MSKHGTIRRYTLIIEKLQRKQFPSSKTLLAYLAQHDFAISKRTLERDFEQIRFEFGIEISYDRGQNGYFIDQENSLNTDSFLRFLEIVNTAELLTESLKESKDTLDYISFESHGDLRGIEHLKPILKAIKEHRKLSFLHENFSSGKKKAYQLQPYLLKEYQNRWYVVGSLGDRDEFRTFGIDRIHELKVHDELFKAAKQITPLELFEHTVGLTYSYHEQQEVLLSFTPFQAKYVKSLPLHKSQKVVSESKEEVNISLDIIPNYELKQKIMMLGENVKVLKPQWLADEIKDSLQKSLKNYT